MTHLIETRRSFAPDQASALRNLAQSIQVDSPASPQARYSYATSEAQPTLIIARPTQNKTQSTLADSLCQAAESAAMANRLQHEAPLRVFYSTQHATPSIPAHSCLGSLALIESPDHAQRVFTMLLSARAQRWFAPNSSQASLAIVPVMPDWQTARSLASAARALGFSISLPPYPPAHRRIRSAQHALYERQLIAYCTNFVCSLCARACAIGLHHAYSRAE